MKYFLACERELISNTLKFKLKLDIKVLSTHVKMSPVLKIIPRTKQRVLYTRKKKYLLRKYVYLLCLFNEMTHFIQI